MQRTINHTGRRKLERSELSITLNEKPGSAPDFDVEFALNADNLPDDAQIYVEAYSSNTLQRFDYGTVASPAPPVNRKLDQLDLNGSTLFRVRVVDESGHIGRLVASAQGIRAESEDDTSDHASLMVLASRPLGQQTWRVNIAEGEKPELVINSAIPDAMGQLKGNPIFRALILPAAFRQVLLFYVWDDQFDEGSPQERWLGFGEMFAGERPHTGDPAEFAAWVDTAVERFSERFRLCEMISLKMEEAQ